MEQPTWQTSFDLAQDKAAETRQRLLDEAGAAGTKIMAYHLPFPRLGRVVPRSAVSWA